MNKYTHEYVWVPCGECSICKNRRSAHYNELLEREKLQHRYCFFVTLTYSNEYVPVLTPGDFVERDNLHDISYFGSRERDSICIPFDDLFPKDKALHPFSKYYMSRCPDWAYCNADLEFFDSWIKYGGLPYASKTDAQLFLKRLNKYAHDHYTSTFKNFRYFLVSELGSTTFRPHFHAIFFVDHPRFAEGFADSVSACWKYGRVDSQFVENSACGYVAQYINKSADMPYVYKHKSLRPFFLCSRNPFIGAFTECPEDDAKIVFNSAVTQAVRKGKHSNEVISVPLQQSYQNRLFPKCPLYSQVSDFVRTEFYTISRRFHGKTLRSFLSSIYDLMVSDIKTELAEFFRYQLKFNEFAQPWNDPCILFDEYSFNFLRRLYYFGRKVARQACLFGLSIYDYIQRIFDYYNKKELYLLSEQYGYQSVVSQLDSDSCALMYPDYLFDNGFSVSQYMHVQECSVALNQCADADYLYFSNKKTHFKNAYLDSLSLKRDSLYLFTLLKTYFYAKKCNETLEAFAS